jgi:hypothetical protein
MGKVWKSAPLFSQSVGNRILTRGVHADMVPSRSHFSVSVVLVTLLLCSASSGQDGLQLFHKMQTALGGADEIASARDFDEVVHADSWFYDGTPRSGVVRKRVRFIRPHYLRIDQSGPGDTYVLYFDGSSGWEINPDGTLTSLAGGDLKFAENYLSGLNLNSWLADRDPSRVITSSGPNVIVVSTKGDSSQKTEITLDPLTFLPAKETGISRADSDRPVHQEMRFDQWEVSGGVRFPRRLSNFHDGKRMAEITVEQIKLNTGMKAGDLAIKPPDLKPVMSGP